MKKVLFMFMLFFVIHLSGGKDVERYYFPNAEYKWRIWGGDGSAYVDVTRKKSGCCGDSVFVGSLLAGWYIVDFGDGTKLPSSYAPMTP
jgi:hypothetical protein